MELFAQSSGCLSSLANDADIMERLEVVCDLATHYLCHQCAQCQEGRELCRHPVFFAPHLVYAMAPPSFQLLCCVVYCNVVSKISHVVMWLLQHILDVRFVILCEA
jgi:hypothetical protein